MFLVQAGRHRHGGGRALRRRLPHHGSPQRDARPGRRAGLRRPRARTRRSAARSSSSARPRTRGGRRGRLPRPAAGARLPRLGHVVRPAGAGGAGAGVVWQVIGAGRAVGVVAHLLASGARAPGAGARSCSCTPARCRRSRGSGPSCSASRWRSAAGRWSDGASAGPSRPCASPASVKESFLLFPAVLGLGLLLRRDLWRAVVMGIPFAVYGAWVAGRARSASTPGRARPTRAGWPGPSTGLADAATGSRTMVDIVAVGFGVAVLAWRYRRRSAGVARLGHHRARRCSPAGTSGTRLAINRTLLPAHIAIGVLLLTGVHDPYDRGRAARGADRRDRVGEVDGVGACWPSAGAVVIDADAITRSLQQPGQPVFDAMVERFGPGIVGRRRHPRPPAVAAIVFTDEAARKDLDAIVHPAVGAEMVRRLQEHAGTDAVVVYDVPLLVESGKTGYGAVVVVDVDPEVAVAPARRAPRLRRGRRPGPDRQPGRPARPAWPSPTSSSTTPAPSRQLEAAGRRAVGVAGRARARGRRRRRRPPAKPEPNPDSGCAEHRYDQRAACPPSRSSPTSQPGRPPARRRSSGWPTASRAASGTRRCSASPARARAPPSPGPSSRCSARRW